MFDKKLPLTYFRFLWIFIYKQFWSFFLMVTSISSIVAWTFSSYLLKDIVNSLVDCLEPTKVFYFIYPSLIALCLSLLIYDIGMRFHFIISAKAIPKFTSSIRKILFEHNIYHSTHHNQENTSKSVGVKIIEIAKGSEVIMKLLINEFLPVGLNLCVSIILLIKAQYFLGAIFSCWIMVHFTIAFFSVGRLMIHSRDCAKKYSTMSSVLMDSLSNAQIIHLFGSYLHETNYFNRFEETLKSSDQKFRIAYQKVSFFLGFMTTVMIISMIILSIYFWSIKEINIGEFILVSSLVFICVDKVWKSGFLMGELFNEIGKCQQMLNSILSCARDMRAHKRTNPILIPKGEIKFKNVSFSYVGLQPIINNLDITIKAGERVGIIGHSGIGKSTLVKLLLRNIDPSHGAIEIDNQNIFEVGILSLRREIAIVPQYIGLFNRSIKENIRYGNLNATDAEVIEAAKKSGCYDFICAFPNKFNTPVGENGNKLSGGQVQRIAIARAFLKNSPILILDEATSALDGTTEKKIQSSLDELMENRTVIIISHRLTTLEKVDRILTLKDGKLIEDGISLKS